VRYLLILKSDREISVLVREIFTFSLKKCAHRKNAQRDEETETHRHVQWPSSTRGQDGKDLRDPQQEFLSEEPALSRDLTTNRVLGKDHDWTDSHERSRVVGTTDCVVHAATNHVKTRVKDHPAQEQIVKLGTDGCSVEWTDEGTKPDAAHAARRNHVDACRLRIRLSELFRVVHPPLDVVRLHVYSCKIMPTTPDVPDSLLR